MSGSGRRWMRPGSRGAAAFAAEATSGAGWPTRPRPQKPSRDERAGCAPTEGLPCLPAGRGGAGGSRTRPCTTRTHQETLCGRAGSSAGTDLTASRAIPRDGRPRRRGPGRIRSRPRTPLVTRPCPPLGGDGALRRPSALTALGQGRESKAVPALRGRGLLPVGGAGGGRVPHRHLQRRLARGAAGRRAHWLRFRSCGRETCPAKPPPHAQHAPVRLRQLQPSFPTQSSARRGLRALPTQIARHAAAAAPTRQWDRPGPLLRRKRAPRGQEGGQGSRGVQAGREGTMRPGGGGQPARARARERGGGSPGTCCDSSAGEAPSLGPAEDPCLGTPRGALARPRSAPDPAGGHLGSLTRACLRTRARLWPDQPGQNASPDCFGAAPDG